MKKRCTILKLEPSKTIAFTVIIILIELFIIVQDSLGNIDPKWLKYYVMILLIFLGVIYIFSKTKKNKEKLAPGGLLIKASMYALSALASIATAILPNLIGGPFMIILSVVAVLVIDIIDVFFEYINLNKDKKVLKYKFKKHMSR